MLRRVTGWLRNQKTLGRWALRAVPDVPWTIRVPPIGALRIRLRRERRFWVRDPLTHERFMFGALQELIRPGDTVYDVGANIGLYARFMVQAFGAGRVMAFEPMAGNRATLLENLRLGGIEDRVRVFDCALADHEGVELLQADDVASGAAALDSVTGGRPSKSHEQYGVAARTERVRVVTLDGLVAGERLEPPAVMKIDVEGAEGMVLRGAARLLREHRPALAIELHGPETAREVFGLLGGIGYSMWCQGYAKGRHWQGPVDARSAEGEREEYEFHFVYASVDPERVRGPFERYVGSRQPRGVRG